MRFDDLLYFFTAAKTNSTSIAAKMLHVTQPTISLAIKRLEQELNISLLHRTYRGVILTPAGEKIYHQIPNVINSIENINAIAAEYQDLSVNKEQFSMLTEIQIHTQDFLANTFPKQIISDACKINIFPNLNKSCNHINKLCDALPYAEKDLALLYIPETNYDIDIIDIPENFTTDIINASKLYYIVSKRNPSFQNDHTISYEDILKYPVIIPSYWKNENCLAKALFQPLYTYGEPLMSIYCDVPTLIYDIVANSEYGFITFKTFDKREYEDELKYIPIKNSKKYLMVAIYKKDHPYINDIRFLVSQIKKNI